ncbi:MAG: hypothetical protein EH225_08820 [Calditrichaeota bacterium]|nr:MAG: hypothetical protein EH225_08820 [Calditrichota bacterium]
MPWFIRMLLYLSPLILLVQLYVGWRFQHAYLQFFSHYPRIVRAVTFGLIGYLNIFPILVFSAALLGRINNLFLFQNHLQWQDYLFLFPYWWGLVVAVAILPYILLLDLSEILFSLKFIPTIRFVDKLFYFLKIFLVFFFMIYAGFRLYYDTYVVRISSYQLKFPELPEKFNGMQISLVADIQIDRYTGERKTDHLKEKMKSIQSDVLLFSGDLVTSGEYFIREGLDVICSLNATNEKIACLGDHDFWANPDSIRQGIENCGWKFLQNEHHLLPWKGDSVLITGISHIYSRRITPEKIDKILSSAPGAGFKILLVHQPAEFIIRTAAKYGYHLVCAGHTHGGQLKFRPFGKVFTLSMFETPYFGGLYELERTKVLVTNGIGLTFAPIRYQAPAEIATITIQSR